MLKPLARVYGLLADSKNRLYQRGWLGSRRVQPVVISVGNLTVGGTGKTPVVEALTRRLVELGHRPAIVCRSYRAKAREPGRVKSDNPELYGDEAVWYAKRFPLVPVWSGPVKWRTAEALANHEKVDVILVDDGFQHRALYRDRDLLVLDASEPLENYACVPAGRGREDFHNAARADAYLLTKVNEAGPHAVAALRARLPAGKPVLEFAYEVTIDKPVERALLVSAIARPQSFRRLVEEKLPHAQLEEITFRDHHGYKESDIVRIARQASALQAQAVFTTEKDEVKLRPIWSLPIPLVGVRLSLRLKGATHELDALFDGLFH